MEENAADDEWPWTKRWDHDDDDEHYYWPYSAKKRTLLWWPTSARHWDSPEEIRMDGDYSRRGAFRVVNVADVVDWK